MLYYISQFSERVRHPKEEQILFSEIKERTHQIDGEIDALIKLRSKGEFLKLRLHEALISYKFGGMDSFQHFYTLVEQYAHFYFTHMRAEEERIIPVAKLVLNETDWKEVDASFIQNQKGMDDTGLRYNYEQLFTEISTFIPE